MELLGRKIDNDRMLTMTMKFFSFFFFFFFELSSNTCVSQYSRTLKQVCTANTPRENLHFLSKNKQENKPSSPLDRNFGKTSSSFFFFFNCSSPTHKKTRPVAAVRVVSMLISKFLRITSD